jgi:hypothetical protein
MKAPFRRLFFVLSCALLALGALSQAEEMWYPGEAECLGVIDGRPRVVLTTTDGKKLALELRGAAESLMSKVLPEGKVAKLKVKGELKNRTLIVTAYEMLPEGQTSN